MDMEGKKTNYLIYDKNKKLNFLPYVTILSITILIFIILLKQVDIVKLRLILINAKINYILLSLILSVLAQFFLNPYPWREILKWLECNISYKESVYLTLASMPIEQILPLKSGKVSRALYLSKKYNFPFSLGIASLIINLIIGFISLFLIIGIGIIFLFSYNFTYSPFFIMHISLKDIFKRYILRFREIPLIIKNFKLQVFLKILLFAIFIDIFQIIVFLVLGKSLGITIPFYKILIFLPMVIIISNLPIAFAGLGVRETSTLFFFSIYASKEGLFSLGILFSFIWYILPSFLGIPLVAVFYRKYYE
jgi:hypothetical protein